MTTEPVEEKEEKLEGLDTTDYFGWGEQYPLDSVFVRTDVRTVAEVVKRIIAGRYEMTPDFQRDFVWEAARQSRLIESCLMRIPLPVFYLAEAEDGKIIVVDGLQRLTTFVRYTDNKFSLTGLGTGEDEKKKNNPLSGKKFSELPLALRERIEDTQLTLYILDSKAPSRAKLDIFERVNSGLPLSRQQMRNSLYNGKATAWLKRASDSKSFIEATGKSLSRKSMRDREAINRFCGFYLLGTSSYKGDMDTFLADTLEHMNSLDEEKLEYLYAKFENSMNNNFVLFQQHAFRKSLASVESNAHRGILNISLFDACSVVFADIEKSLVEGYEDELREAFDDLLLNPEFSNSITYSTNSTSQVLKRLDLVKAVVETISTLGELF